MGVFISYRRTNKFFAHIIYYGLLSKGYNVFIDSENVRSGSFPQQLEDAVKANQYFIVVLDEISLRKTKYKKDWFDKEIQIAISEGKTIIPVTINGFEFPKKRWKSGWLDHSALGECEAISWIADKIPETINSIAKMLKDEVASGAALQILKTSVSDCETKSITECIITLDELQAKAGSEIHLLTDNLHNYDCTTVSKIAISRNISNSVKYIYYCPKSCEKDFNRLKRSVLSFISREGTANKELDRWCRSLYLCNANFVKKMETVHNKRLDDFINEILGSAEEDIKAELKDCLDDFCVYDDSSLIFSFNTLIDWVNGNGETSDRITEFVTALQTAKAIIEDNGLTNQNGSEKQWVEVFNYLNEVLQIANWIRDPFNKNLIDGAKRLCRKFKIDNQIIDWLDSDFSSCKDYAGNNLIFVNIDGDESLPFTPCYSFSFYTGANGEYLGGTWYTASNLSDESMENTVVIHEFVREEKEIAQKLFNILKSVAQRRNIDPCGE